MDKLIYFVNIISNFDRLLKLKWKEYMADDLLYLFRKAIFYNKKVGGSLQKDTLNKNFFQTRGVVWRRDL